MERKFKWLLSCLSLGVLLIYSNEHILQPFQIENQKLHHGLYHQECQCYRDIIAEKEVDDTFSNYSSLTCSAVSGY